ncbi:MAG: HlyD family efflux transporter periplasmic adaptor subunit [Eubacteriales bacterium]|nr:HlyD family efflux transporter periplasmic adaptor subunit [Eubacteriales bacterium]
MLKKCLAMFLVLSLALVSVPALAESVHVDFSGRVEYTDTVSVLAPFGGNLADFSLRAGDTVTAGEALFALSTTKVYAPFNGIVRGLRATPGDDAAQVADRYGALLYLEPEGLYTVSATTNGAYNGNDTHNVNRYLNQGDTVYLESTDDEARTGTGIITSVDGRSFTVEVLQSNLELEETVNLFRDEAMTTANRIARSARVQHATATAVTAEGSVLRCAVTEGQSVQRGDLLFETVDGALTGLLPAGDTVVSPADGVVVSVAKAAGDAVAKDAVLATLYEQASLRIVFNADESDLDSISVGQKADLTFDALPQRAAFTGTVESVSSLPLSDTGSPQYEVTLLPDDATGLLNGMSVTVRLQ